ncbi:hypothetical protein P9112_007805 [Eukaryota sp. TZLM1-RC]
MVYYKPKETFGVIETTGITKASKRIDKLVILSFLAGVYISFGGLAALVAGGRMETVGASFLVYSAVFPVGTLNVKYLFHIIAGAELFTGNTMFLIPPLLKHRVVILDIGRVWFFSFIFNFAASFLVALVFYNILAGAAGGLLLTTIVSSKIALPFFTIFFRAIGANWIVNLAILMAYASNEIAGKILAIWFSIFTFVLVGLEHSIANVFFFAAALFAGGTDITFGVLLWKLVPATLGNILGGAGFVGVLYSYIHTVEKTGRQIYPPPTPLLTGEKKHVAPRPMSPIVPTGDVASNSLRSAESEPNVLLPSARPPSPPPVRKRVVPRV